MIGVLFTIFSIYVAIFFWEAIFGNMVGALWRGGPGSRILLLVLALFLAGPAIRGLITLGRTTARRLRGLWRRLKFRFETSWRVEAAEMIDALPAFDELPEDVLSDLAGRVRLVSLRPGEPIFRQGDRPTAFYVVRRGTLDVEEEDPDTGDTVVLRTVTRGEAFGELGLIQSAPRAATVRAVDDVELFEVDKATFDRLLADSIDVPAFALTLQTMAELRDMPAFAMLSSEGISEILTQGRWITAAPGDVIDRARDGRRCVLCPQVGTGRCRSATGSSWARLEQGAISERSRSCGTSRAPRPSSLALPCVPSDSLARGSMVWFGRHSSAGR